MASEEPARVRPDSGLESGVFANRFILTFRQIVKYIVIMSQARGDIQPRLKMECTVG
jgi:hypothetical protein